MRYVGQGFEIDVPLPAGPYDGTDRILAAFRAAYERIFTRTIDWAEVELVALRCVATLSLTDASAPLLLDEPAVAGGLAAPRHRACWRRHDRGPLPAAGARKPARSPVPR